MAHPVSLLAPDRGEPARDLHIVTEEAAPAFLVTLPAPAKAAVEAGGFKGKGGEMAIVPGQDQDRWSAIAVVPASGPTIWSLAKAAESLPAGTYRPQGHGAGEGEIGWVLAQYRFDRYRREKTEAEPRILLTKEPAQLETRLAIAEAVAQVRDLVNTPAADMGPAEIEQEVRRLGDRHGADVAVIKDEELLAGAPMIHAVGRAASRGRGPRLITLAWGNPEHPRIALVGKGVCFDSGGLDIKPASGMRLMKKDMGGAAHALALAGLVMRLRLPVRLQLLIPAVENAISGDAFRPGDILTARNGLSVEIGNTDAEGRLVLADALVMAAEQEPELIIDFATLTGAARVALGPDLPALFANDDAVAKDIRKAGQAVADPVWRLPLHDGYEDMLASDVADMNNSPDGGFAGAIAAALFLQRFVPPAIPWAHLDTFAWSASARPGRPRGGEALGMRAVWSMLEHRYGRS